MATSWRLSRNEKGQGGPNWEDMDTSIDNYELLTNHFWEWIRNWNIIGKSGFVGGKWSSKTLTWPNVTDKFRLINWTITTNTKKITGTES
jgi:hypothetical protein